LKLLTNAKIIYEQVYYYKINNSEFKKTNYSKNTAFRGWNSYNIVLLSIYITSKFHILTMPEFFIKTYLFAIHTACKKWINWRASFTAIILGIIAFISYHSCITYDFLNYDDQRVLIEHPELYNQPNAIVTFKAIILENYPREEPLLLRDLSWALDSRIFGFKNPRGAHFGNILIHSFVIILFFVFILTLTRKYKTALVAAILSLSLAVHVEPVVWVMGRKDVLVSFFGLLAMIATIRMTDSSGKPSKIIYYFLTLLFVFMGFFSKISAIVFPLTLMVLAVLRPYLCTDRLPDDSLPWKRTFYYIIIFIPHLIMSFIVYKWYNGVLTAYGIMEREYDATALEHLRNLLIINPLVFWRYMSNIVMPIKLSLFYNWPSISSNFAWYHIALSAATILVSLGLAVFMFLKRKDLLCYFLIFWVLMIPYLNLVYFGIWVANRYIYFSSFFILAMATTAFIPILESKSKLIRGAIIFLLFAFCIFNISNRSKYMKVWENDETLWSYEVALPDPRPEAFENLANHYYTIGRQNIELRNICFSNVNKLIDTARYKLGNSPKDKPLPVLYRMLFLDALMSIVQEASYDEQLEKLLLVEKLKPDFDAVLWQLTVLEYKQALKTKDQEAQKTLVEHSLIWYKRYLSAAKNDVNARKKDKSVRAEFISDFPFVKDKINALDN
jgi:hypothetical protein